MHIETAHIIALQAVAHIFSEDSLSDRFISLTGFDQSDLAVLIQQELAAPASHTNQSGQGTIAGQSVLFAVLDFYMQFEPDLLALAADCEADPADIQRAWIALGGDPSQLGY